MHRNSIIAPHSVNSNQGLPEGQGVSSPGVQVARDDGSALNAE